MSLARFIAAAIPFSKFWDNFDDLKLFKPASVVPFFEATDVINSSRLLLSIIEFETPSNKLEIIISFFDLSSSQSFNILFSYTFKR